MRKVLPVIVVSQFLCTSPWFAGNAIMPDIARHFNLPPVYLAYLANAVQSGFIIGTLLFAILGIPDRISPSKVFFISAIIAAFFNILICLDGLNAFLLILFRFLTGFFLAGIYPVGMKIASDHYREGLGRSLGFLVGALVVGTSFPHLLKSLPGLPWNSVIYFTSLLSVMGGLAMFLFVPDGKYRAAGQKLNTTGFIKGFRTPGFRAAAFGYFGHMWELYAFWVFVPVMLAAYKHQFPDTGFNVSLLSFLIIASGGISCVISGLISRKFGVKKVAVVALGSSCTCCIISPLFLFSPSATALIVFLFIWGMAVIADSPLFSTLVAQNAPPESKGTALTIVNCIGFAITIVSIQLLNALQTLNVKYIYMLLAIGPVMGLTGLLRKKDGTSQLKGKPEEVIPD